MRRKKAARFPWQRFLPVGLLVVIAVFGVYEAGNPFAAPFAHAASGNNYAWSENIGWISLDCANENACASSNYKVQEDDSTGAISGYAWSENIGWVSFNASDVTGCPMESVDKGSCSPRVDLSQTDSQGNHPIIGWARACGSFDSQASCSGPQSDAGGWQGWIHLSGPNYSLAQSGGTCNVTSYSYAWGGGNAADGSDADVGWIHFAGSGYQASLIDPTNNNCNHAPATPSAASITVAPASGWSDTTNPSIIRNPGGAGDVTITLTTTNIASCDSVIGGGDATIPVSNNDLSNSGTTKTTTYSGKATNSSASGTNTKPYTFSLNCTGTNGVSYPLSAQISVGGVSAPVACVPSLSASPSKVKKGGSTTLSYTTSASCSACVITDSPVSPTYSPSNPTGGYVIPTANGSNPTDPITQTTTYTLSCNGGAASSQVPVSIEPTIIEI